MSVNICSNQILTNIWEYLGEVRLNIATASSSKYVICYWQKHWLICDRFAEILFDHLARPDNTLWSKTPPRSPVWVRVASELKVKDTLREAQWTRANANKGAITNKSCVQRKLVICLLFAENLCPRQSMQENWTQTFLLHRQVFTTKNVFQDKTGFEPT